MLPHAGEIHKLEIHHHGAVLFCEFNHTFWIHLVLRLLMLTSLMKGSSYWETVQGRNGKGKQS